MKNLYVRTICLLMSLVFFCVPINYGATRFNMSYLYGNYNYITLVERTNNSLNEVSPSYFDITSNGGLKLNTVDETFVTEMHKNGVKVIPFLSNHWDRAVGRAALSNRISLVSEIVSAINKYNLDGINVDIENVTDADRDNYTDLVRLLKEKLPEGKTISVAVAANPNNWTTGWHGSYDYEALAKYADYLMMMTYDEHYESGEAGPVASIEFVENSIKYATARVDSGKIVLGIPFFGRYWKDGSSYGGYGVSLARIETLLKTYKNTVTYDEKAKSVKAIIEISSEDTKPVINSKTLTAGTYIFWYENEESIKAKLALVSKYNLKGTGSWSLGQETSNTWDYYNISLNGTDSFYSDVKTDEWFYNAVKLVKENEIMNGKSSNIFAPNDNLTRAEFATIIARFMKLNVTSSLISYKDTVNHWAKDYIEAVTKSGYMEGKSKELFYPDDFITREEIAKVLSLAQVEGMTVGGVYYKDLVSTSWSYNYIIDVTKKGLVSGYPDETFMPQNKVTRAEIAQIISRIK